MTIINSVGEMQLYAAELRRRGQSIVLVPTMGYLHSGHLAHIERGRSEGDLVVASIFVNPTQFAPHEDLANYPRNIESDCQKLEEAGCDVVFIPSTDEIYPEGYATSVAVEGITSRYEGAIRPNHFSGVTTVVAKLLNIVTPHIVTFGQKDAQQVAVVRRMMRDLNYGVRVVTIETMRDPDGLAMSSRNVYLSAEDREVALTIPHALFAAHDLVEAGGSLSDAVEVLRRTLSPMITPDYADIVDPETFEPVGEDAGGGLAIVAGRVGRARLIDNLLIRPVGAARRGGPPWPP
jgi:pantoate--beta-alanine ligase